MLRWRIAVSIVLIPTLIGIFRLDAASGNTALPLLLLCLVLAARASWEMTSLLRTRSMQPSFKPTAAGSLLAVLAGWMHVIVSAGSGQTDVMSAASNPVLMSMGWIGIAAVLSFCGLLVREAVQFHEPGTSMESLGSHLISVFYSGVLIAVLAQFRWFPDVRIGYFAIGSMIVAVKSGDIGAYTFGRLWGKRKMAPRLSPGKTWMGFTGAIVGSILGGGLWLLFAGNLFDARPVASSLAVVVTYCAFLGVIGLIGDLCESLIKRDVQKKDSAVLMPGFGGLLDILDSPLFAGPFALLWWHLLPPAVVQ